MGDPRLLLAEVHAPEITSSGGWNPQQWGGGAGGWQETFTPLAPLSPSEGGNWFGCHMPGFLHRPLGPFHKPHMEMYRSQSGPERPEAWVRL